MLTDSQRTLAGSVRLPRAGHTDHHRILCLSPSPVSFVRRPSLECPAQSHMAGGEAGREDDMGQFVGFGGGFAAVSITESSSIPVSSVSTGD